MLHCRAATAKAAAAAEAAAGGASAEQLADVNRLLEEEKSKSQALEEENKALRGQVATVLSYLDQVMPMGDAEQQQAPQ